MSYIEKLSGRLKNHPKRVVFPEGNDPRIIQAARKFASQRLGVPILLGDRTEIKQTAEQLNISLDHIRVLNPAESDDLEIFMQMFQGLKRFKGLGEKDCRDYVLNRNFFATLMVATDRASALVSGATTSASSALRPILKILPRRRGINSVSSMMIHQVDYTQSGFSRTLAMADCAVIPDPTAEQLADIAITTASISYHITNVKPRVAFLSYSSKSSSSKSPSVLKVKAATELTRKKAYDYNMEMDIDGELQVDAALDPKVARQKKVSSAVAGDANVLIFPDLNSANITSKMMQMVSGAHAYGQIITGLQKPVAEISRAASAHDIFGTAVIVAAQAVDHHLLYHSPEDKIE